MHRSSDNSLDFASQSIEDFFRAHYFLSQSLDVEDLPSVESILNMGNFDHKEYSPAFKLVLDHILEKCDPLTLYKKLVPAIEDVIFD